MTTAMATGAVLVLSGATDCGLWLQQQRWALMMSSASSSSTGGGICSHWLLPLLPSSLPLLPCLPLPTLLTAARVSRPRLHPRFMCQRLTASTWSLLAVLNSSDCRA